jgi:GH24 family phage-related lysozyme (muramidase)
MKIPDSLKKVISSKVLKKAEAGDSKVSGLKELDSLSQNLSFLPNIAKDINIARQNIFKLVKLEGGKPERASNVAAGKEGKSPSPVFKDQAPMKKKEEKEESSFEKGQRFANFFLDLLSPKKILGKLSLTKIFAAVGIVTLFKDAFLGLADYLWDAIQESFTKFVDYIGEWFKEVVKPIFAELTIFMEKIWGNIKDFFKPIFDWVAGKINTVLEFLQPIFNFIGDIFGKLMVYVDKFKEKLAFLNDTYNSIQNQISAAKESLANASGPSSEVQYDTMGNVISDSGAQAAAEQAQKKKEAEEAKKKKDEEAAKAAAEQARKKKEADDAKSAAATKAAADAKAAASAKAAAPNAVPTNFGKAVNPYEGQTKTPSQTNASQGGRGGPTAADMAKKDLTPSQLKWLGDADPTDPYIMARMPPPQPGEKGGPPKTPTPAPAAPPAAAPAAPTPAAKPAASPAGGGSVSDSKAMIIRHEGKAKLVGAGQYRPYKDSKGLWTIGIGHLIGDGKTLPPEYDRVFTETEIMKMFEEDYAHHAAAAAKVPGFNLLGKAGQDALIDMTFNMGNSWYKKFPKAIQALAKGDFKAAADELTNSEWYKQVKGRAVEIVAIIRNSISPEPVKGGDTQVAKAETTSPSPASAAPVAAPTSAKSAAPAVPAVAITSKPISEGSAGGGVSNLKLADFVKFGTESGQKLNWEMLDEKFQQKLLSVLQAFKTAGGKLPVQLASATRTQTDQERIYNTWLAAGGGPDKKTAGGITTPAKPVSMGGKYNAHTGGAAVDFGKAAESIAKAVGGPSGDLSKFGLKWGGTFSKPDEVHIQDAEFPLGGVTAKEAAAKGFDINRASVSVAADQREQQKPTTPVVIDASTTNNTQVTKNESGGNKTKADTNKKLLDRVT